MTYLDPRAPDHPKWKAAGPLGFALGVAAICWSTANQTRGFIPADAIGTIFDADGYSEPTGLGTLQEVTTDDLADRLVGLRLWEAVIGGWRIHDYAAWQGAACAEPPVETVDNLPSPPRSPSRLGRLSPRTPLSTHSTHPPYPPTLPGAGAAPQPPAPGRAPVDADGVWLPAEQAEAEGWEVVPAVPRPKAPRVRSALAATEAIVHGLSEARAAGANTWDLPKRLMAQFDTLMQDGDVAGASALLLWYAEFHGYAPSTDRERRQGPRLAWLLVSNYGRFGARALLEALRAAPDNLWPYATRTAQRMVAEAQAAGR